MKSSITAKKFSYFNTTLVRLTDSRAIVVITRCISRSYSTEDLLIKAAIVAIRNGWKKVIISNSDYDDYEIRAYNISQWRNEQWQQGYNGVHVGWVEECF